LDPSKIGVHEAKRTVHETVVLTANDLKANEEDRKEAENRAKIAQGQRSWSMLHRYRGCDPVFFEAWQHTIPNMCDCRNEFKTIVADFPPDFSCPDAFWRWGWFIHNAVNEKLGKPLISLEEATQLWRNDGEVEENRGSD
jgi:hypothetical protein